jgi:hypothetical protein
MATTDPDLQASKGFHDNPIDLSIKFRLSEGTFHDQVTAAIEGGSNYWARVDVGEHQPGWRNYFTAKFTIIEISDEKAGAIKGQTYELSLDKLKAGLQVLAEKYPHHFGDVIREMGDATTGDVLVQCALFGEIVYG